jgi:ribosomal protein S18 acetylase RimI-like enzyme
MSVEMKFFSDDVHDLWPVANALAEIEEMNFGGNGFDAWFIASELTNTQGVAVLLLDDDRVVGYIASMKASEAYVQDRHYRDRDSQGAAYVSNASIHPDYQKQGHVWQMMAMMEQSLKKMGYEFLDGDYKNDVGYADKVVTRYGDRVVFANPAVRTLWGMQRYIRIRL